MKLYLQEAALKSVACIQSRSHLLNGVNHFQSEYTVLRLSSVFFVFFKVSTWDNRRILNVSMKCHKMMIKASGF